MKSTTSAAAIFIGLTSTIAALPTGFTIVPTTISIYHGFKGQIEYNKPSGKIQRLQSGNDDISTLITFDFPEATRHKTCEFMFELDDSTSTLADGTQIDVFTNSQIATQDSPGWGPPSNFRDQQLGRLTLVKGGEARKEWGSFTFPCPTGLKKGYEVAPTGDKLTVTWNEPTDGPWVKYY